MSHTKVAQDEDLITMINQIDSNSLKIKTTITQSHYQLTTTLCKNPSNKTHSSIKILIRQTLEGCLKDKFNIN